jgi:phosphoenolpyruvate phosphomutase
MFNKKKIVYVPLAIDFIHSGHLNIIRTAKKFGKVVVGLLTDEAISQYKKLPTLNYEERLKIVSNIKDVDQVIAQNDWDYSQTIKMLKPDYFIHGDDWKKKRTQKKIRSNVIKLLKKYSGKLIEPKYTQSISSDDIKKKILENLTPNLRISILKRLIDKKKFVRVLEAHNPISALIAEKASYTKNGIVQEFDCMWSSSLADSTTRGKPDNQSVDYSTRLFGLNEIFDVTTRPMIFDGDNGGEMHHIPYLIKTLERLGVSAIAIEDKIGVKQNSLFADQSKSKQDSIKNFCKKIKLIQKTKKSNDFLLITRIESLIMNKGLKDALKRAEAYSKAGCDLILIHSKSKHTKEIFEFSSQFKKSKYFKPLVCVPSTYSHVKEKDLIKNHFSVVIYANHLLRSIYPAMTSAAEGILKNQRSKDIEKKLTSIKEIISLIPKI